MMTLVPVLVAAALAAPPRDLAGDRPPAELQLIAEMAPDLQRRCIPGPHELGRTLRLPGTPMTSAAPWFNSRSFDAFPHCRDDAEAAPPAGRQRRKTRR